MAVVCRVTPTVLLALVLRLDGSDVTELVNVVIPHPNPASLSSGTRIGGKPAVLQALV